MDKLAALASVLGAAMDTAEGRGRTLLALATEDAQEGDLDALGAEADRLERDGERLGAPLGPALAALIRRALV